MSRRLTPRIWYDLLALPLLLLAIFFLTQVIYSVPRSATFTADTPFDALARSGFHELERFAGRADAYRWTRGEAQLHLPNPGGGVIARMLLAGGPERSVAVRVQSGRLSLPFVVDSPPRTYTLLLPAGPSERLSLQIDSPVMQEATSPRQLGVVVGALQIAGGHAVPRAILLAVLLVTAGVYGSMRWGGLPVIAAAGGTLLLLGGMLVWQGTGGWRYAIFIPTLLTVGITVGIIAVAGRVLQVVRRQDRVAWHARRVLGVAVLDWLALSLLVIATAAYFRPYLFTGTTPIAYDLLPRIAPWRLGDSSSPKNVLFGDVIRQYVPWRYFYRAAYLSGEVPFWNPYTFGGMPFLANIQSGVFYPFNLLFLLDSVETGCTLFLVFHLFVTGLGMYLLLRAQTLPPPAALVGALTWMFCGYLTNWLLWLSITATLTWLPWCFLFTDLIVTQGRRRAIAALGLVVALMLLGGHIQFAYYGLLATGAWALWRTGIRTLTWRQRGRRFAGFLGGAVLGMAIASVQLLPTFELARQITRDTAPIQALMAVATPWYRLLTLLIFDFYGNVNAFRGPGNFVENTGYVGLTSLIFCALALLHPQIRRQSGLWFFGLLAVVALHLAYGGMLNVPLSYLPGYTLFRALQRMHSLWSFGAAAVAAWGVEAVLLAQGWRRRLIVGVAAVLLVGGLVGIGQVHSVAAGIGHLVEPLHIPYGSGLARESLRWTSGLLAGTGLALIGLSLASSSKRSGMLILAFAPALLVSLDLVHYSRAYLPVVDAARVYPTTPGLEYLRARRDAGRVLRFGQGAYGSPLPSNNGIIYSLEDIDGYDSFMLQKYNRLVSVSEPERYDYAIRTNSLGGLKRLESLGSPVLRLLGAAFLLVDSPLPDSGASQSQVNQAAGELVAGYEIGQTFRVDQDGLYRIDLSIATYARPNRGRLWLELRPAPDSAQVLAAQEVNVARLYDGQSLAFEFPPIAASAGRTFYVGVRGDSQPGAAVTVLKHNADVYAGGTFWLNRRAADGDLRFTAYTTGTESVAARYGWVRVYSGADMTIYHNQAALPLAFVVGDAQIHPAEQAQLDALAHPTFDPVRQAVLAQPLPLPLDPEAVGEVRIARRSLNTLELDVQVDAAPDRAALLLVRQNYYPGWEAHVDGVETPVLQANYTLQGVLLTPGSHRVSLSFTPSYFGVTLTVALLALAISVALLIGWLPGRRRV